jgi:hypothetical protein
MCDYSLEMYQSRPARAGETLRTTRFPSGSIGMTDPAVPGCAVCMGDGTTLELDGIPPELAARHGVATRAMASFVRLDTGLYRDGLRFENGVELSLQQLPPGIEVKFIDVVAEIGVDPAQPQVVREPLQTHDGPVLVPAA